MIADNLKRINDQIAKAALKVNRRREDIKLVAVSKHFPVAQIIEAYAAGQIIFGENYIQEMQTKKEQAPASAIFHFIGQNRG